MVQARFPSHLTRHFPVPTPVEVDGATVAEAVSNLDAQFPGLAAYLIHEDGSLRQHVNIFLDNRLIKDRKTLNDPLDGVDELIVMQALSGG